MICGRLVILFIGLIIMKLLLKVVNSSGVVLLLMCVSVSSMLVMMFEWVVWIRICSVSFYCGMFSDSVVLCSVEGIRCSILLVVCMIIGSVISVSVMLLVKLEKVVLLWVSVVFGSIMMV